MTTNGATIPIELDRYILEWVEEHPLTPSDIDCATTVMLKILDGKCKMKPDSKIVMEILYDMIKHQDGELLDSNIHDLIRNSRHTLTDELRNHIYEQRLLAETIISRPVMKNFKSMIRTQGLFDSPVLSELQVTE